MCNSFQLQSGVCTLWHASVKRQGRDIGEWEPILPLVVALQPEGCRDDFPRPKPANLKRKISNFLIFEEDVRIVSRRRSACQDVDPHPQVRRLWHLTESNRLHCPQAASSKRSARTCRYAVDRDMGLFGNGPKDSAMQPTRFGVPSLARHCTGSPAATRTPGPAA